MRFLETGDAGIGVVVLMTWRERLWRKPVPSCDLLSREFSCHLDGKQRLLAGTQQSDQPDFVSYVKAEAKKKTENKKQENMPDPCLVTVKAGPQHSRVGLTQH